MKTYNSCDENGKNMMNIQKQNALAMAYHTSIEMLSEKISPEKIAIRTAAAYRELAKMMGPKKQNYRMCPVLTSPGHFFFRGYTLMINFNKYSQISLLKAYESNLKRWAEGTCISLSEALKLQKEYKEK